MGGRSSEAAGAGETAAALYARARPAGGPAPGRARRRSRRPGVEGQRRRTGPPAMGGHGTRSRMIGGRGRLRTPPRHRRRWWGRSGRGDSGRRARGRLPAGGGRTAHPSPTTRWRRARRRARPCGRHPTGRTRAKPAVSTAHPLAPAPVLAPVLAPAPAASPDLPPAPAASPAPAPGEVPCAGRLPVVGWAYLPGVGRLGDPAPGPRRLPPCWGVSPTVGACEATAGRAPAPPYGTRSGRAGRCSGAPLRRGGVSAACGSGWARRRAEGVGGGRRRWGRRSDG